MSDPSPQRGTRLLRYAALLAMVEGAALAVAGLVVGGLILFSDPDDTGRAIVEAVFALAAGAGLVLLGRALSRHRSWARSPVVVFQVLALPVGYSLTFDSGRPYVGIPVLVAAAAEIYLLFAPGSTAELDRNGSAR